MICISIDELVPCLKDSTTGEFVETEVVRIRRKSFLQKFNSKNGWYVNWSALTPKNEVYALVIKGTVDIQGLVAVEDNTDYDAVYIAWAVAAPFNNPEYCEQKKYVGVGGHLLAIAAERSMALGHEGFLTGFCRNEDILQHFVKEYGAVPIRMLQEHQIAFYPDAAQRIREVYDYEWTDEEL